MAFLSGRISITISICTSTSIHREDVTVRTHVLRLDLDATFFQAVLDVLGLVALVVPQAADEVVEGFLEPGNQGNRLVECMEAWGVGYHGHGCWRPLGWVSVSTWDVGELATSRLGVVVRGCSWVRRKEKMCGM